MVIKDYEDLFEAVVVLEPRSGYVELRVTKDREASGQPHPALRLDPRTLLILE